MNWLLLLYLKMSSLTARGIEEWAINMIVKIKYDSASAIKRRLERKGKRCVACLFVDICILSIYEPHKNYIF